jgi:hypothetical protein
MPRSTVFAALIGLAVPVLLATPAAADVDDEVVAYAWANDPTSASYHPDATYAYNSAGGPITINRSSAGRYTVVFGDAAATGGVVHVQAYGSNPRIACTVTRWGPTLVPSTDLLISVRCFTAPNTPADSQFVVGFTNAYLTGTGRLSYFWTDQANPVGVRTLTHAYRYDSTGGPLAYERISIGVYRVHLPPNPAGLAGTFPMMHVTPYANEWVACQVPYPDLRIVTCARADGDPVDTLFTLTYGLRVDLTGHVAGPHGSGVLYAETIAGPVISGDSYVSSPGGGMTGTVLGPGSYVVTMRGIGGVGGHATVTAVGEMDWDRPPLGKCSVVGWWREGADQKVRVACSALGPGFAARNMNVRVTYTRYRAPV